MAELGIREARKGSWRFASESGWLFGLGKDMSLDGPALVSAKIVNLVSQSSDLEVMRKNRSPVRFCVAFRSRTDIGLDLRWGSED